MPKAPTTPKQQTEGDGALSTFNYSGHDEGLVITQPESGKFVERPMTAGELAARAPAQAISMDIHRLATYANLAYINVWDIIAPAMNAALAAQQKKPITPAEREALREQHQMLDEAGTKILEARRPFDVAFRAIESAKESLLARHEVEIAGHCVGCSALILSGDMAHVCFDGDPIMCEGCAPTWAESLAGFEEEAAKPENTQREPGDLDDCLATARAHVAEGRGDSKHVWKME